MSYDSILKFLLDEYPIPILSWLLDTPITEKIEILKTELNVEPIRADSVFFLQVGNANCASGISNNTPIQTPLTPENARLLGAFISHQRNQTEKGVL